MFPEPEVTGSPTPPRDAVLRGWSVVGLGLALFAASLAYFAVSGEFDFGGFVQFAVPIGVSLFVVALGGWLRTAAFPAGLLNAVFLWSVAGGVVMGLLAGWTSLLQSTAGGSMFQPASVVLTKVAVGVLGGGLLGVYHGRLEQRTAELAEQRNRLDEFASIVSHDLRNPMNVAQGHLELARETGEDRHFEKTGDALGRMESLIGDLLKLARQGQDVDDTEQVDLEAVVRRAWSTVSTGDASLDVDDGLGDVEADDGRLQELLENLFRNAVEHGSTSPRSDTREDAVEHGSTSNRPEADDAVEHAGESVTVRVGRLDHGFFVEDDGPGIPEDIREDVTDRGFTTTDEGTGVGLAAVSGVADSNDWRLAVTDGRLPAGDPGARFEFRDVMFVTDPRDPVPVGDPVPLSGGADVGDVSVRGDAVHDPETDRWTVTGEGVNVYRDKVGFHYRYATVEGDVRIEGTVGGVEDVYPFSKGGLMVRGSLAPEAAHGFAGRIASGESEVLWATGPDADTHSQQFGNARDRLDRFRVDREGAIVTVSVRYGDSWVAVDQRRVALEDPVHVGLAVCSVTPGETCTVTFEDVTVRRLESDRTDAGALCGRSSRPTPSGRSRWSSWRSRSGGVRPS